MKKYYIIILFALLFAGCEQDDVWQDYDDPRVYIPKYGFSLNKVWLYDSNESTINLSVNCAGLRPENRKQEIAVDYIIAPDLIEEYNANVLNPYAGQITELPADCYGVSDRIVIPKGISHGELAIKIDLLKIKELGLKVSEIKYAIPIRLQAASMYNLQEDSRMLEAIYCITLDEPTFYFWDNRETDKNIITVPVTYGEDNLATSKEFRITSYGLESGEEYSLNIAVEESVLASGQKVLPSDAYEIPATVTIPANSSEIYLPVKIINNKVNFRTDYYLPVAISSASKYKPDANKGILWLKVNIKNEYEWSYKSMLSVQSEGTGRSAGYTLTKAPVSYDKDILEFLMLPSASIAGYYNSGTGTSNLYANKYFRVQIIPTDDKDKYQVEYISISGKTPDGFEAHPEQESWYDYNKETFHLNYRFRDQKNNWVNVSEILEAQ